MDHQQFEEFWRTWQEYDRRELEQAAGLNFDELAADEDIVQRHLKDSRPEVRRIALVVAVKCFNKDGAYFDSCLRFLKSDPFDKIRSEAVHLIEESDVTPVRLIEVIEVLLGTLLNGSEKVSVRHTAYTALLKHACGVSPRDRIPVILGRFTEVVDWKLVADLAARYRS